MKHRFLLSLLGAVVLSVSSLQAANMNSLKASQQMMKKQGKKGGSIFLVDSGLPHMTKLVKMNWENPQLALTKAQKEQLLVVRQETMGGVKKLKPQIMKLQEEIRRLTMQGVDTEVISPLIDQLAILKADASRVHVGCIHDTSKILTKEQRAFLLQR